MLIKYTCNRCDKEQARTFSRKAYREGVVIVKCEKCRRHHLIADNKKWFEDNTVNIEELMKRKG